MTGSLRYDIENFPELTGETTEEILLKVDWFNRTNKRFCPPTSKENFIPSKTFHKNLIQRLNLIFVPIPRKHSPDEKSLAMAIYNIEHEYARIRFRPDARYIKPIKCVTYGQVWKGSVAKYEVCIDPNRRLFSSEQVRGKLTKEMKESILSRDGYRCQQSGCGCDVRERMHVHHIQPVSKDGDNIPGNLITLCDKCNWEIGNDWIPVSLNAARPMVLSW